MGFVVQFLNWRHACRSIIRRLQVLPPFQFFDHTASICILVRLFHHEIGEWLCASLDGRSSQFFSAEGASAPQLPADWSPTRPWYRSIGQGRGAALNTASASNAYV